MRKTKKCAYEGHDHKERCDDGAHRGKQDRPVQKHGSEFLAGDVALLRLVLEASSSLIAFNACDLSMMRFIRAISKEMNPGTAPKRNEGAVTWAMTCASCMVDDVSEGMVRVNAYASRVASISISYRKGSESKRNR
jgi:hypothetical protein